MTESPMLRRNLLKAGVFAVLLRAARALGSSKEQSTAAAAGQGRSNTTKEDLIRTYYVGWVKKQWSTVEGVLAGDFTFTSPNDDDHINKRDFKDRCWPTAGLIDTIEMECVIVNGDDGFAKYLLTTTDKKSLRNTEYFKFKNEKVSGIEVYFGGKRGYPGQQV